MDRRSPLDKRIVVVTGKGGAGKSTLTAALGLLAAARGRRTVIVEVGGQWRLAELLGAREPLPDAEVEVAPGLHAVSIDPDRALRQYLEDQLPLRALSELLGQSRMFSYLAAATPGLRELLTLGKVWDLVQPQRRTSAEPGYELAILDAPATGHALGLLRAPRTFSEIARVGPVARHAGIIDGLLRDPRRTGVVAVAQPAEMPVNETVALCRELARGADAAHLPPLDGVIVNGIYPRRFGPRDAKRLEAALATAATPEARAALRAALSERARVRFQREQLARLAEETGREPLELPYVFDHDDGRATVERLAAALEGAV